MGQEQRSVLVGVAGTFITVGSFLWVSLHPLGWIPGLTLVVFGLAIFSSLLTGSPFSSMQTDVREGTEDGIPWHSPLDYQIDQLRQIIPNFNGEAFDEYGLRAMIPKAKRARIRRFHEPFQNFQWREGAEYLVSTGELELVSNFCWRATGRKPPPRWLSRMQRQ